MSLSSSYQLVLAPMAGITDLPFRLTCKSFGADIVYSEMISATGLFYCQRNSYALLASSIHEQPVFFQLFGSQPQHFATASRLITHHLKQLNITQAGLDINFGCPAKKVIRQESGVALMRQPALARDIIKAVLDNTSFPVSIKIRAGIGRSSALNFLETLADLNWQAVIIHARTFEAGFSGPVDFTSIRKIKVLFPSKKVIVNGGIFTVNDAEKALRLSQADGLAIARGALGRPWIFQQIKAHLLNRISPPLPSVKKIILQHAHLVEKQYKTLIPFRKHLGWYLKGQPHTKQARQKLAMVNSLQDVATILKDVPF